MDDDNDDMLKDDYDMENEKKDDYDNEETKEQEDSDENLSVDLSDEEAKGNIPELKEKKVIELDEEV